MLANYEHQQHNRRKNLATLDENGHLVFLYRMSDLPITQYRTCNYPNPYIDANHIVTQAELTGETPLELAAWNGGSRHAEWREHRRQILERDRYTCQHCGDKDNLEVHHIQPRHERGTDNPSNLVTLCENCHTKSDVYRAYFKRSTQTVKGEPVAFNGARRVR